jgi:hypothetical protein
VIGLISWRNRRICTCAILFCQVKYSQEEDMIIVPELKVNKNFGINSFLYSIVSLCNWLRAGQPWGRSSSPCKAKNVLFSTSSRSALGPNQPPIQWVSGAGKAAVDEADRSPPISAKVKKTRIYTSTTTICFHVVVLNYLSTGVTLPYLSNR